MMNKPQNDYSPCVEFKIYTFIFVVLIFIQSVNVSAESMSDKSIPWQPDSTPLQGVMRRSNDWMWMTQGMGALVSTYFLPTALHKEYGDRPFSYMLFVRLKLG